jgi:AcrR family transcriptional regulator
MAYRKTPKTAARKEARRTVLLEAATQLFGRCGYHATTVPMIVAESNSSVGSFYAHFRNKEDVFATALDTLGQKIREVTEQARTSQSDPLKQISCAVELLFLFLAKTPQEARILIVESSGLSPRLDQVRRSILRRQEEQLCQVLESNPDAFSVMVPAIAAQCLVGAVFEALYTWLEQNPDERSSAAEVARAVADYNCRALRR